MKKHTVKFFGLLLSAAMILGLSATAFAGTPSTVPGTIPGSGTIVNARRMMKAGTETIVSITKENTAVLDLTRLKHLGSSYDKYSIIVSGDMERFKVQEKIIKKILQDELENKQQTKVDKLIKDEDNVETNRYHTMKEAKGAKAMTKTLLNMLNAK